MGKIYKFNEDQINDMVNLYVNEITSTMFIAEKYNVDSSVIKRVLTERGVEIIKGSAFSVGFWVKRGLSEEESKRKIKEMKPNLMEYWLSRGFSTEESKLNTELHLMNTERAFIIKYGEENGVKLFRDMKTTQGKLYSKRSIEYWLNKGFSVEESKNKVSESQNTFSLVKCVEKYGEEEGKKMFTERQNKWQESLTKNGNMKMGYSKISQELFYKILETYNINYRDKIKFATHNGEFKMDNPKGGVYIYDFIDTITKKIIEYNGDMYHANPKKFKKMDTPHPYRKNKTSLEIWESDKNKIDVVKNNGYDVLVIWDSEYRWGNKEKVIKKCIKFLKNEN
jgi:hypothetical protein